MCSKTRSLSQKRDTALHNALHAVLHAALHAFSMSFSLSNLFFDLSTQKPTRRCMQRDVAFVQRSAALRCTACCCIQCNWSQILLHIKNASHCSRRLAAHPNCTFKTQV
jgi:hypothetical protein